MWRCPMNLSRRDFLRFSVSAAGGTALAGLVGSGVNLAPVVARAQELRIKNAKVTPSVCPYCSVGCATLVQTVEGKIVNIEGDPRSPHNEGALCPKGAAIYQLHVNPNRPTRVLHRHLLPRRRHAGLRMESRPAEADARPRHRRHREPGKDLTQLQRPRFGD